MKKTQEQKQKDWIDYCSIKHNHRYDYSLVVYQTSEIKVKIICPHHNLTFEQKAGNHRNGQGCPECGKEKILAIAKNRRSTQEEAIIEFEKTHGKDRYDYSQAKFTTWNKKVDIRCLKCNQSFSQNATNHRNGQGCPTCGIKQRTESYRISFDEFLQRSKENHPNDFDNYEYDKNSYIDLQNELKIKCLICDKWFFQLGQVHISGGGCTVCSHKLQGLLQRTGETELRKQLAEIHGNRFEYLYSTDEWKSKSKIFRRCNICKDERFQHLSNLLLGQGCGKCSRTDKHTTQSFKELLENIHGLNTFDYSRLNYIGNKTKVELRCIRCDWWFSAAPGNLLYKGCAKCAAKKFASAKEIAWLNYLGIEQQHRGAFLSIENRRFNLDALVENTKTIYEFNGDFWHGNPAVHEPEDVIWSHNGPMTAKEAYDKTIDKENTLKNAGYQLVTIWESDWNTLACNSVPLPKKYHSNIRLLSTDTKQWCFSTESQKVGMKFSALNENGKFAFDVVDLDDDINHCSNWDAKKDIAKANNLQFSLFFSDEIEEKYPIIEKMIKHKLHLNHNRIFARQCSVVELSLKQRKKFFDENHIDGNSAALFCFGLVSKDGIIQAAMSVRKPQQSKLYHDSLEVARFAVGDLACIGAIGKLSKACLIKSKELGYHHLMTYVDQRIGSGNGYLKSGWKFVKNTDRRWWWTNGAKRFDRFKFRAQNNKSEKQVAQEAGVHKIWGCSNLVLKYE